MTRSNRFADSCVLTVMLTCSDHPLHPADSTPWPESVPDDLWSDLRSDHAGETGAVEIYRGILAIARDPELRAFAREHLATERRHLEWMQRLLPPGRRSRLLPLWRAAGWTTGALPALCGRRAVFRTIDAVEGFVDRHYAGQIEMLRGRTGDAALLVLLEACRADEIAHREDARRRLGPPGIVGRLWTAVVGLGSRAGVYLARRF